MNRFAVWRVFNSPGRYGIYFAGATLTNVGTWAQNFAAVLLMHRLTGSVVQVGLVTVVQFAAPILLVRWTGSVADRFDRRHVVAICQALSALCTSVLVLGSAFDIITAPMLLGVMLVLGIFQALQSPAQLALTPLLVSREQLDLALSLNAAQFNLARAVGPVIASALVLQFGFTVVFALNTCTFLGFLLAVLMLRPEPQERPTDPGSLRLTLGLIRRTRYLTTLMLVTFVLSGATDPVITLGPSLSILLTGSDETTGLIVASFGVGATIAAFFLSGWTQRFRRRLPAAMGIQALGLVVVAFSSSLPLSLIGIAVSGGAFIIGCNRALALVQSLVPPSMLGRVMAVWAVAFATSRPVFAVLDGYIGDLASPRWAVGLTGVILATAALLMWAQGRGGKRRHATSLTTTHMLAQPEPMGVAAAEQASGFRVEPERSPLATSTKDSNEVDNVDSRSWSRSSDHPGGQNGRRVEHEVEGRTGTSQHD